MGEDAGVKYNEKQFEVSKPYIVRILKALVANNIWKSTEYFRIVNEEDKVIEKALQVLADTEVYNKILGFK
jgi:carboxyl-terminal processing protease